MEKKLRPTGAIRTFAQTLRFSFAGIVNSVVGLAVFMVFHELVGVSPHLANALAYAFGLAMAATLFRRWVFPSGRDLKSYLSRFLFAFLLAFLTNQAVLSVCVGVFLVPAVIAQIISMAAYSLVFFLFARALLPLR